MVDLSTAMFKYQRVNPIQTPLNHHFPMVFLWFSYGLPMFNYQRVPKKSWCNAPTSIMVSASSKATHQKARCAKSMDAPSSKASNIGPGTFFFQYLPIIWVNCKYFTHLIFFLMAIEGEDFPLNKNMVPRVWEKSEIHYIKSPGLLREVHGNIWRFSSHT